MCQCINLHGYIYSQKSIKANAIKIVCVYQCMLLQSCKCELQPDCTCCKVKKRQIYQKYSRKTAPLFLISVCVCLEMLRVPGLPVQRVLLLCGHVPQGMGLSMDHFSQGYYEYLE